MPTKHVVLTDQARSLDWPELTLGSHEVGGPARGYLVHKRRLEGGLSSGVEMVEVDNGRLRFRLLPTRGMALWKAWLGDIEFGWRSPARGPVHPAFVPVGEPSGLGFLDGFDELLTRCGLSSNGAPDFDARGNLAFPLHGRIANLPAHYLDATIDGQSGEIRITGEVAETRFLVRNWKLRSSIVTRVGQAGFTIEDEVTNASGRADEFQLLYHINLGPPLLEEGAEFSAPVKELAPRNARAAQDTATWNRYAAPRAGYAEQVHFMTLMADEEQRVQTLLANRAGTLGFSLKYPIAQLPWFVLWKNTGAEEDGYVTGLEPATNFPNPRSFEKQQGRVVRLEPGESAKFSLEFSLLSSADEVGAARRDSSHSRARRNRNTSRSQAGLERGRRLTGC